MQGLKPPNDPRVERNLLSTPSIEQPIIEALSEYEAHTEIPFMLVPFTSQSRLTQKVRTQAGMRRLRIPSVRAVWLQLLTLQLGALASRSKRPSQYV